MSGALAPNFIRNRVHASLSGFPNKCTAGSQRNEDYRKITTKPKQLLEVLLFYNHTAFTPKLKL